ncbi:MAG TPA: hypothetical protein VGQ65_11680 [Thermoanaerobaculia bacterium]|jgi:hypothetical protein|nr:hypothetical protein [Thermoanaerobaculia bacterium]
MKKLTIAWNATLALLYVLALPIYAAKWLRRAVESLFNLSELRKGFIDCPHCGFRNPLDILALCRRCGMAEFGSRLYCTTCKQVTKAFPCDRCTAAIRVL